MNTTIMATMITMTNKITMTTMVSWSPPICLQWGRWWCCCLPSRCPSHHPPRPCSGIWKYLRLSNVNIINNIFVIIISKNKYIVLWYINMHSWHWWGCLNYFPFSGNPTQPNTTQRKMCPVSFHRWDWRSVILDPFLGNKFHPTVEDQG